MFCVGLDGLDDQVEFVGAVDFAKDAVGLIGQDALGFGEVVEPVDGVGVAVFHEEHGAGAILGPRDQDEMIGAEVKHGVSGEGRRFRPQRQRR